MSFTPRTSSSSSSILLQCLSRPGPSRLAASRTRACPSCRRAASTSVDSEPITPGSPESEAALLGGTPSSTKSVEELATDALAGEGRPRGFGGNRNDDSRNARVKPDAPGYQNWLKSVATLYREPPANGPNWLGKEIPYPSNPSFRPPPPLSNDLKDLIYSEVYTGGSSSSAVLSTLESLKSSSSPSADASLELQKRINRVSEEFGISKKRIEAVLKLKEHERGMKERGEIMQTPFLTAMEKYLAVRPIRPPKTPSSTRSWGWESQERAFRRSHPSTSLEASEESAHEAFAQGKTVGQDSSAFTFRDTIEAERGVERAVWEFRETNKPMEENQPVEVETLDVPYNRIFSAEDSAQQQSIKEAGRAERNASRRKTPTVGQDNIASKLVERLVLPKKNSKPAVFSFVNTSDSGAIGMSSVGRGKMQNEHGQREKKARRSERVQKAKAEMAQRQAAKRV